MMFASAAPCKTCHCGSPVPRLPCHMAHACRVCRACGKLRRQPSLLTCRRRAAGPLAVAAARLDLLHHAGSQGSELHLHASAAAHLRVTRHQHARASAKNKAARAAPTRTHACKHACVLHACCGFASHARQTVQTWPPRHEPRAMSGSRTGACRTRSAGPRRVAAPDRDLHCTRTSCPTWCRCLGTCRTAAAETWTASCNAMQQDVQR